MNNSDSSDAVTTSESPDSLGLATEGSPPVRSKAALSCISSRQNSLNQVLRDRNDLLSTMFIGGILVLADTSNPERFAQCAHSMRELMEKLPQLLDLPTKAHNERLGDKVNEIQTAFLLSQKRTRCYSVSSGWDGEIDGHLRTFLIRIGTFFEWLTTHRPRRKAEIRAVFSSLDSSGRPLPEQLADLNVTTWMDMKDYFVRVSHHQAVDENEFLGRMDALERFLLDQLAPRTFDDFEEIDKILEESSDDAK